MGNLIKVRLQATLQFINAFHSCKNLSCPKYHTKQTWQWFEKPLLELLPVPYFHTTSFSYPSDTVQNECELPSVGDEMVLCSHCKTGRQVLDKKLFWKKSMEIFI